MVVEEEKRGVARVVAGKEGGAGKVEAREETLLVGLTTLAQLSTTVKGKTSFIIIILMIMIILSQVKH